LRKVFKAGLLTASHGITVVDGRSVEFFIPVLKFVRTTYGIHVPVISFIGMDGNEIPIIKGVNARIGVWREDNLFLVQ